MENVSKDNVVSTGVIQMFYRWIIVIVGLIYLWNKFWDKIIQYSQLTTFHLSYWSNLVAANIFKPRMSAIFANTRNHMKFQTKTVLDIHIDFYERSLALGWAKIQLRAVQFNSHRIRSNYVDLHCTLSVSLTSSNVSFMYLALG